MNHWTQLSIDLANQANYLDQLFVVYPLAPDSVRNISGNRWSPIETAFNNHDNAALIRGLLSLPLFPIKDSYVAYLKRDRNALQRNPETVNRLCSRIYEMGLTTVFEKSSQPKETNRQLGAAFRRWVERGLLGLDTLHLELFRNSTENAVLVGTDSELWAFAREKLGYQGGKSPDFIARMHSHYIVGETKFLTDFGGHQDTQFLDATRLLHDGTVNAVKIAILDGVLYIPGRSKMYTQIVTHEECVLSSLLLRDFLYQI